jgi:hypothetical protein
VVTRRSLLAGGAVVLLSGCGEEEEHVVAAPADALLRQLAAERALAAATARPPRGTSGPAADTVREISTRARERAARLAAAVSAEGGRPHDAPQPADERVVPGEAVARAQAAIVAHVVALPSLTGRDLRRLGAELVNGAAADTALLSDALGIPVDDPFPGTPR